MASTIFSIIAIVCCYVSCIISAAQWYLELDRYSRKIHGGSSIAWCVAGTFQLLALLLK